MILFQIFPSVLFIDDIVKGFKSLWNVLVSIGDAIVSGFNAVVSFVSFLIDSIGLVFTYFELFLGMISIFFDGYAFLGDGCSAILIFAVVGMAVTLIKDLL